jgi:hypothetical protein
MSSGCKALEPPRLRGVWNSTFQGHPNPMTFLRHWLTATALHPAASHTPDKTNKHKYSELTGIGKPLSHDRAQRRALSGVWRRERDSNPRAPYEANGFQDRRFQPLTHPSRPIQFSMTLYYRALPGCLRGPANQVEISARPGVFVVRFRPCEQFIFSCSWF